MTPTLDRVTRLWLRIIRQSGVLLLTAGIGLALLAPLEMHCFTLFTAGGPCYYPGFGYGSFMFANIAAQIAGYLMLAALLIPLGYGHVTARRWIVPLGEAYAQAWLVAGMPLVLATLAVLLTSKAMGVALAVIASVLLAAAYPAVPWLAGRFYLRVGVRRALDQDAQEATWVERVPVPALGLAILYLCLIPVHGVLILLHGLFPLYGRWLTGLSGTLALDLSMGLLALLAWATLASAPLASAPLSRHRWAPWTGLAAVTLGGASWIVTLGATSWPALLAILALPTEEVAMLDGIPLQGWHLAAMVALPWLLLLTQILRAGRAGDRRMAPAPA